MAREGAFFGVPTGGDPSDTDRAEPRAWMEALRAGRNSFTPEVLERLRSR